MRQPIEIGKLKFTSKKDALLHYKTILNSYEIGEELNENDFNDLFALLETHPKVTEKIGVGIKTIKIGQIKKYNVKSFELVRNDNSTDFFSYTKRIKSPKKDFTKFSEACRQAVQEDLRNTKLAYFKNYSKKGQVKCQETGELLKWTELNIDHRQPNTFSVIVDRFIELNNLNISKIEYLIIDNISREFANKQLIKDFKQYHKEKANLRIVKSELNLGRSFQARVRTQKKDLRID